MLGFGRSFDRFIESAHLNNDVFEWLNPRIIAHACDPPGQLVIHFSVRADTDCPHFRNIEHWYAGRIFGDAPNNSPVPVSHDEFTKTNQGAKQGLPRIG